MDPHLIKRVIEAALLASPNPLTLPQMAGLFDEFAMPAQAELAAAVAGLQADCAGRGIELVEVASGFRYQVRGDVHPFVARLWAERPSRYSRAMLETLALIAYRQPITRGEIEQIRGVAVSSNIVRTLEEREWVRVVGHRDVPGRPALLGTTRQFLDYFKLKSLDELPALSEIHDLEDFEPELPLDGGEAPIPAQVALNDELPAADAEAGNAGTNPDAADASAPHEGSDDAALATPGASVAGTSGIPAQPADAALPEPSPADPAGAAQDTPETTA
ncbi:MAG: SMC-Scp complex subunit ScpB [Xanthomonadales bacterium]|nr:SMC-Scp complex subunit ScpB [Xanthomonadales bacterium]